MQRHTSVRKKHQDNCTVLTGKFSLELYVFYFTLKEQFKLVYMLNIKLHAYKYESHCDVIIYLQWRDAGRSTSSSGRTIGNRSCHTGIAWVTAVKQTEHPRPPLCKPLWSNRRQPFRGMYTHGIRINISARFQNDRRKYQRRKWRLCEFTTQFFMVLQNYAFL